MAKECPKAIKPELIKMVNQAIELKTDLWEKLREIEQLIGSDIDGLERIIDNCAAGEGSLGDAPAAFKAFWDSLEIEAEE